MKVFIDTSAFVALFVDKEESHQKVSKKYFDYRQERAALFTSYYVLDELFTRLLYYPKLDLKKHVQSFREAILANELTVLDVNETIFDRSLDIFLKFSEHKISFTDATTYVLYKDFKLDEIFTLDRGFKKIRANTAPI